MEDDCPMIWMFCPASLFREALSITISAMEGSANMTKIHVSAARLDESGSLVAATEEEDIWAWNNGEKWGDELPTALDNE
jgi:hypothetical protein